MIGSIYRAVNEESSFPAKVHLTLNHPGDDSHGTMHWIETTINPKGTIIYQDTRGDQVCVCMHEREGERERERGGEKEMEGKEREKEQEIETHLAKPIPTLYYSFLKLCSIVTLLCTTVQEYNTTERTIHEQSLRGMYRDGAGLNAATFLSKEWWVSRRFFWERGLLEMPHCVVFVFDGSSEPFLDAESLSFFQEVFEDCTRMGQCLALRITAHWEHCSCIPSHA